MRLSCRPLETADAPPLTALLRRGMPFDAFLLDSLDTGGIAGFIGAWDGANLVGAVLHRRSTLCAAVGTSQLAARTIASMLGPRESWTSVVGPEDPCRAIVESFRTSEPFRVDRVQAYMAISRGDRMELGGSGVRPATARDLDRLVPIVARYRVEDGLSRAGDDHGAWIRAHTMERILGGNIFVVEERGEIVFTGAFNFAGRHGAGLGGIYTIPAARGRGIASRATADLCRIAFEKGPAATLHVDPRNARAIRAYENAGLRRLGEFRLTFR